MERRILRDALVKVGFADEVIGRVFENCVLLFGVPHIEEDPQSEHE